MNGEGEEKMEEDRTEMVVLMWGYLPGSSPQKSSLLVPTPVRHPPSLVGEPWKDVCGGGCGFAMAISETGKLVTWGSTDDLGQSYVTSGKHQETPEPFPLPTKVSIVKAAAGWAHCVAATDSGEVYTWGWKECVPTGKVIVDPSTGMNFERETSETQGGILSEQASPQSQPSRPSEESTKRRKTSSKQAPESSASCDETVIAHPCVVSLNPGVAIVMVAAGGRHSLALSDVGQVWGWGYGGEGQVGLGSRIRMVSSPHPIPCIETSVYERSSVHPRGNMNSEEQAYRVLGNRVKAIACGGRHSAAITDTGAVLTFGWGLYGQCGHGSTDDELSPTCVTSLLGIRMQGVAAGLWHTICISEDGSVYAFGGNQFGQLGTGGDQAETLPRLLDSAVLESKHATIVSCGARHSVIITDGGEVFSWGWNKYGQLGLGDVIDRSIPSQVSIDGCLPRNVACGWWHTLVMAESPI